MTARPIPNITTITTTNLLHTTRQHAIDAHGTNSHHLATTITRGHFIDICREFDETWHACQTYHRAEDTPNEPAARAHFREEAAQLAALLLTLTDLLGPTTNTPWHATTETSTP